MSLVDRNRAKLRCFRHLLENGVTALHLDARQEGVEVPARFQGDPWLVLNYSYRYNVADFTFDENGVTASLSFGGQPHVCFVPWNAVFAITDDARTEGQHWQEDAPTDPKRAPDQAKRAQAEPRRRPALRPAPAQAAATESDELPDTSNEPPARRGLQVIAGGRVGDPADDDLNAPDAASAPRAPAHLRVVKNNR